MSIIPFRYVLVTLFSLLTAAAVQAGEGRTRLDRYFSDFVTLQARFEQTLVDENGKALERSQGTVYLWRPGRFRWDYEAPYEQSIVADGKKVWIYDMELRDNFGQTTRIRFSKEQRNAKLKHSLFGFTPPPGVDVLDAAGDS
jgi:chaperone LolA